MSNTSTLATYPIQYIGCIPINISIKSLNFRERTQIAREGIMRVCEDVGLRVPPDRPPPVNGLSRYIGNGTDLTWTRQSVRLTISVNGVTVQDFHSDQILFHHRLSAISFASSGEADMMDFVGYIAKTDDDEATAGGDTTANDGRAAAARRCYVFYCSGGCSRDFITSIGEAFKLGYKGFKQSQQSPNFNPPLPRPVIDDLDPPLPQAPAPPVPVDPWFAPQNKNNNNNCCSNAAEFEDRVDDSAWLLQDPPKQAMGGAFAGSGQEAWVAFGQQQQQQQQTPTNPFQPPSSLAPLPLPSLEPVGEPWYVGAVSRQRAEALLQYDGDFLVRASTQQPNQFVLSGMQNGKKRHLLLINPEGQVRTKDRVFSSIQELIDFHLRSTTPIRSADSELKLVFPVSPNVLLGDH